MNSNHTEFVPGNHFPANRKAPDRNGILSELSKYGYTGQGNISLIDTSRASDDIRLNYVIDKKWVLRFCNAPEMTETRLIELNRLIERYLQFGLKCPRFLTDQNGRFFHAWDGLNCYLQEYIDLPTANEVRLEPDEEDRVWQEVLDSVAAFAEMFKNVDLSSTMGMYSLFDLAPYDIPIGKDEKQQNFEKLCQTLLEIRETRFVERLQAKHTMIRERIRSVYKTLPRCVFQADENLSNILVDKNHHLAGLIDFNMAGTEVIVNQFANLGGGFQESITEPIGANRRMQYAIDCYHKYQERMIQIYHATALEKRAMKWYHWIALVAGWPQVCFFLYGLKTETLKNEILELLSLLTDDF